MRNINDTLPAFFPAHPVSYWERQEKRDDEQVRKGMLIVDFQRGDHSIREIVQEVVQEVVKPVEATPTLVIADDDWHHPFWMAKMAQDNGLVVLASFDGGEFRKPDLPVLLWFFLKDNCEHPSLRYRIEGADRDGWIKNDFSGKPPIPDGVRHKVLFDAGRFSVSYSDSASSWDWSEYDTLRIFAWGFAQ